MCAAQSPAFSFAEGVLHIDTPQARMRLQWQPEPLAEELVPGARRWRQFWPEFRLIRPQTSPNREQPYSLDLHVDGVTQELAEKKAAAFASFRSELPAEIVRVVEPFGSHQWALMVLLRQKPRSMDLAIGNPVLAYCLANSYEFRGTRPEAAAVQALWHCHRKQRWILAWLGFPGTEAMVRLTRKILPESASPTVLRCLRNAAKADEEVLERLAHLPRVNLGVLQLVATQGLSELVAPKLLLEVAAMDDNAGEPPIGDMVRRGMGMRRALGPGRNITPFTRIEQVRQFHDEFDAAQQAALQRLEAERVAEQERRRRQEEARTGRRGQRSRSAEVPRPYPSPPVPGTEDIIPLTSAEQLRIEGVKQSNCVGSYAWRVLQGDTYVYRVMGPDRATLAIVRGADGCWRRSELKARKNRKVKASTVAHVDRWLARHSLSVG
jgi:hypothetical protein